MNTKQAALPELPPALFEGLGKALRKLLNNKPMVTSRGGVNLFRLGAPGMVTTGTIETPNALWGAHAIDNKLFLGLKPRSTNLNFKELEREAGSLASHEYTPHLS